MVSSKRLLVALFAATSSLFSIVASAQTPTDQTPTFATSSAPTSDWTSPWHRKNNQDAANARHLGIGVTGAGFITGRWEVANGGIFELDVVWRRAMQTRYRLEVGGAFRMVSTRDALLLGGIVPFRFVAGVTDRVEMDLGLAMGYTRILFDQPFFASRNGFVMSAKWSLGYLVNSSVAFGITPLGLSVLAGERVDPVVTYEPAIWARFSPI